MGALIILALTVLVSLIGLWGAPAVIALNLFRPYWFLPRRQYWTALSNGLVHADLAHLLLNCISYAFFAFALEREIGTARFVSLYLLGLLASNTGTYFKHRRDPEYASLGSSGAVLAVLFASIAYFPHRSIMIMPIPVPIPAPLFAVCYLLYTYFAARTQRGRINHDAHFDGALAGLAFVLLTDPQALERAWHSYFPH